MDWRLAVLVLTTCLQCVYTVCDKRPIWNLRRSFNIRAGSIGWVRIDCSGSQVYDIVKCQCVDNINRGCSVSTEINFQRQTSSPGWVINNTVSVNSVDGFATFFGNGQITYGQDLGPFALGTPVTIRFRYRESQQIQTRQVLAASNECQGCNNASTILITVETNKFNVQLSTYNGGVVRIPINTEGFSITAWKDVIILYKERSLTVIIKSDTYEYIHQKWAPQVDILQCGMRYGSDSSAAAKFAGDIQYIRHYQCEPNDLY